MSLGELLTEMVEKGASDLHLKVESAPAFVSTGSWFLPAA